MYKFYPILECFFEDKDEISLKRFTMLFQDIRDEKRQNEAKGRK